MNFQGLVLFIFLNRSEGNFFYRVYHRYFSKPFNITAQYLLDFQTNSHNRNMCQIDSPQKSVTFRVRFDLVEGTMEVKYDLSNSKMFISCFSYKDLGYELQDKSIFLSLQSFINTSEESLIQISQFQVHEKKHLLSDSQAYSISHELNDEIISQIKSYSQYLEKNKSKLSSFLKTQQQLVTKSNSFKFMVKDFYNGSRRF